MFTIILLVATIIISIVGFQNQEFFNTYKFNGVMVYHKKEWQRMISHGFLHADMFHLAINMYVLYIFGKNVEYMFGASDMSFPAVYFLLLYLSSIPIASLPSLYKHKNHEWYNSIGASGATSAVVFATIFMAPSTKLMVFPIPVYIPAYILGPLFLVFSYYMGKRGKDNINHDAHIAGAIYGFVFPLFIDPALFNSFVPMY